MLPVFVSRRCHKKKV